MALFDTVRYLNTRNRVRYGNTEGTVDSLEVVSGRANAYFADLSLDSVFQPIVDLNRGVTVAHEALLRARSKSGQPVSVEAAFTRPRGAEELVYLDRLSRTLHALNFVEHSQAGGGQLYLSVDPRHLVAVHDHGLVFEGILRHCGLAPERVVLELLEGAIEDLNMLRRAIGNFRSRGFRIAIDRFGRGHANVDRLWELTPDVVRFDRLLLVKASSDRKVRAVLPKLVDVAKAHDALVLFEGIETPEHWNIARESGVELAQGDYVGRPQSQCLPAERSIEPRRGPSERPLGSEPPTASTSRALTGRSGGRSGGSVW